MREQSQSSSCGDPPAVVLTRHVWLGDHLKFMDSLLRPTELRQWSGTKDEHCATLSQYYRAGETFLVSFGDLIKEEDPPLFELIKAHRHEISLLLTNNNIGRSLEQPDGRVKGIRQEGPYKKNWENRPADRSYKPQKGAVEPPTRSLRDRGRSQ